VNFYKKTDFGYIIKIKAVPNSSVNKIVGEIDGALKIKLKAPAVEGAANKELIKFLSKKFKIPKADISIKKGETSKIKEIEISNPKLEIDAFLSKLSSF
jgi:uncharacterized protein (TIGR00251 family)